MYESAELERKLVNLVSMTFVRVCLVYHMTSHFSSVIFHHLSRLLESVWLVIEMHLESAELFSQTDCNMQKHKMELYFVSFSLLNIFFLQFCKWRWVCSMIIGSAAGFANNKNMLHVQSAAEYYLYTDNRWPSGF